MALARRIPPPAFRALFSAAGSLGWALAGPRRRTALANMAHLVPGATLGARRRLARQLFRHLLEDASDLFRLPQLDRAALSDLVRAEGLEHLRAAHALGRGVVMVTGHLGPYELGGAYLAALGFPVHAVVEDLDPRANDALAAYRRATGMELVSRNTGGRQLYRVLKRGDVALLVADRVVGPGTDGLVVRFGDACRSVPTGPATLALATGAPLLVGSIVRGEAGGTRYVLRVDAPIEPAGRDRDALTHEIATRLDTLTRSHPDQWYVFQPEWLPRDAGA